MSNSQISGVNLATGKLSFPANLGSLSGPNGFGSSISLNYSTTGLVGQVRTWDEDAPTNIVGLEWSLQAAFTIVRAGNGSWQDNFFLMLGNQTIPLLLTQRPLITGNFSTLEFVTQSESLNKITYDVSSETWTLIDSDGNSCTYGGAGTSAVDLGIRWISQTDGQPAVWIGSFLESTEQENYAVAWRLNQKITPSGQKVNYTWAQIQQTVDTKSSNGLYYTIPNYLTEIQVENGGSLTFTYGDKQPNEFPVFRWNATQPTSLPLSSQTTHKNAFQDRIETKYLASLSFYNVDQQLQRQVNLNYAFLYNNFRDSLTASKVSKMDKRLLMSIQSLTADGVQMGKLKPLSVWDTLC